MASNIFYRRSEAIIKKTTPLNLSHQTIWRMVVRVTDPYLEKAEQALRWFQEMGEITGEEKEAVEHLFLETDGVVLLQRERQKRAEVKVGIACEGWDKVGKDRYRTVNKTAYTGSSHRNRFLGRHDLKGNIIFPV